MFPTASRLQIEGGRIYFKDSAIAHLSNQSDKSSYLICSLFDLFWGKLNSLIFFLKDLLLVVLEPKAASGNLLVHVGLCTGPGEPELNRKTEPKISRTEYIR